MLNGGQGSVSLEKVTQMALARNPSIAAAHARWRMASQRTPQEAAWEDPKLNFRSLLGRFYEVPENGFTNQMVSLEQSIPISGGTSRDIDSLIQSAKRPSFCSNLSSILL
jgi:outer membrane protein TolC